MPGDFLVLVCRERSADDFVQAARGWRAELKTKGWREAWSSPSVLAMVRGEPGPPTQTITSRCGLVIGETYPRSPGVEAIQMGFDEAAFERQCRRLCSDYWGQYVAFRWPSENRTLAVFRDPSGAADCLTWQVVGVTVVTSSAQLDVPAALRPRLRLDWSRIAGFVADPGRIADQPAFDGVRAIWPGEVWYDAPAPRTRQIWSPRLHAIPVDRSDEEMQRELVRRVDQCVTARLTHTRRTLVEVSGGLDSSIVSTSGAQVAEPNVVAWLNYRASNLRSDERNYARLAAERGGFELTEVARAVTRFNVEDWKRLSGGLRPALNGLETQRDADLAGRCADFGVDQVLTGQGGDVVFFQEPTGLVVADLIQSGAGIGQVLAAARDVAHWTRQSAWSVLREAVGAVRGRLWASPYAAWSPITEGCLEAAKAGGHPWRRDLEGVAPAKRLQIAALTACQSYYGDSQTARQAAVIHPMLSQPVVELCLQLPTPKLTRCRRDRAFAREAFADRVPAAIINRRAKGELASHYGQMVAASLDDLRPMLLDGELVRHGLLDRDALDVHLTTEHLILSGNAFAVASVALVEAWVSDWVAKLV